MDIYCGKVVWCSLKEIAANVQYYIANCKYDEIYMIYRHSTTTEDEETAKTILYLFDVVFISYQKGGAKKKKNEKKKKCKLKKSIPVVLLD